MQICFSAHVGGVLLASLQGSASQLRSPLSSSHQLFFFQPDFVFSFPSPTCVQIAPSPARIREQVSRSSSLASCTDLLLSLTPARTPSVSQLFCQPTKSSRNKGKLLKSNKNPLLRRNPLDPAWLPSLQTAIQKQFMPL